MRRRLVCALIALSLGTAAQSDPWAAQFLQNLRWPKAAHQSGGFSGLELSIDGARFVAISDSGVMLYGAIRRDDTGIAALTIDRRRRLVRSLDPKAKDAEGVAVSPDGTLYVSFERQHRVERFAKTGAGQVLPLGGPFANLPENGGIEALAIDRQGRLIAIPERSGRINRAFAVWRLEGAWRPIGQLPRSAGFLPVGADIGPDDRLYVLERAFPGFGFRSRVRSFALSPGGLKDARTHLQSPIWRFDNLEALSVWRDRFGRIRLTMISDDNFAALQSTQIVEYALPLAKASANR